ncbi:hypothetical protein B0H19DRAFT_134430 [Mycena capillaripes]|nr:hypothetical protein B0H19DRAFT_134430 [Mycena capillaripes]
MLHSIKNFKIVRERDTGRYEFICLPSSYLGAQWALISFLLPSKPRPTNVDIFSAWMNIVLLGLPVAAARSVLADEPRVNLRKLCSALTVPAAFFVCLASVLNNRPSAWVELRVLICKIYLAAGWMKLRIMLHFRSSIFIARLPNATAEAFLLAFTSAPASLILWNAVVCSSGMEKRAIVVTFGA